MTRGCINYYTACALHISDGTHCPTDLNLKKNSNYNYNTTMYCIISTIIIMYMYCHTNMQLILTKDERCKQCTTTIIVMKISSIIPIAS